MIEIYGKDGCSYCEKALNLVKYYQIEHVYHKIGRDLTLDEFKEKFPGQRTVPVILTHGFRIGGYDDFVGYIEENNDRRSD